MRTFQILLTALAVLCAGLTAWIGFGHWPEQADHVFGWLGAALALYLISDLIDLVDRP